MPKPLQKSLQDYLSKIKKPTTPHIPTHISSSTSWILRGCKHTKTLSISVDPHLNNANNDAATLADIDRFLFENFKSLYMNDDDDEGKQKNKKGDDRGEEKTGGFLFESPRLIDPPPDLCASHRFFVATDTSSSLMEEARISATTSENTGSSSTTTTTTAAATATTGTNEYSTARVNDNANKQVMGPDDFIAVFTYSPSPCDDFRHSMQEMIEARRQYYGKVDWEFMEELLFCYLNLNDKKTYKHILSAFVDLISTLRENCGKVTARSQQIRSAGNRKK
ncbi:unnamed protein product [Camellia sinensis]